MSLIRVSVLSATVSLLTACATGNPSVGLCLEDNLCPLVIYEKSPSVFAVFPDHLEAQPQNKNRTLVWTFARQDLYYFDAGAGDGVTIVTSPGADRPFRSCLITDYNKHSFDPVNSKGRYLRCELANTQDKFFTTYKIKFSAQGGRTLYVDPTVGSTGAAIARAAQSNSPVPQPAVDPRPQERVRLDPANLPDQMVTVQLLTNAPVTTVVPLEGTGQRTRVIWTAPTGTHFYPSTKEGIIFTSINAPTTGCTATSDASGTTPTSERTFYYVCYLPLGYQYYPTTYTATFGTADDKLQSVANNMLVRQ